jgi:hypothetical protein
VNKKLSEFANFTAPWRASEIMVTFGKVGLNHLGAHKYFRDLVSSTLMYDL